MKHCKPVDVAQLIAEHERRINAMGGPRAYAERVHAASDAARAQQKSLSSEPTSEVEAYVRVAFVQLIEMDAGARARQDAGPANLRRAARLYSQRSDV